MSGEELPAGWVGTSLGVIRLDLSQTVDPRDNKNQTFELYSIPSFPSGKPEIVTGKEIGSAKKLLEPNAVIVSKINPRINRIWIVQNKTNYVKIGSSEWIPFFELQDILPDYLAYFLRRDHFRNYLAANVSGVGGSLMRVRPEILDPYSFVLPPLSEQHRIVAAIESYLTRLEDAIASLERVQRNLKRYRASVLKAAVEGRLVSTEAELAREEGREYQPATVLLERILIERREKWIEDSAEKARAKAEAKAKEKGETWTVADDTRTLKAERAKAEKKYQEPAAPDTSGLPDLPEGWCWASVGALISNGPQNGLYLPQSQYGSGIPIVRIDDYQTDWSRSSSELQSVQATPDDVTKYSLALGDLVVNRVNSMTHLGKCFVVEKRHLPAVFESNMMRFSVSRRVLPTFVKMYLSTITGKQMLIRNAKWAVNQASINQQDVQETPLRLAPTDEQERIQTEVDRFLSIADETAEQTTTNLARAHRLRQSILKWAFEGKLVDQDPNDEPASALLERIKAERAAREAEQKANKKTRKKKVAK